MLDKGIQIINDEIISYNQSLYDVDEKIKLLKFLDSVDNALKQTLNLDNEELLIKRKELKDKLTKLLNLKWKLMGENESIEDTLKNHSNKFNTTSLNNHLSLLCNYSYDLDTLIDKKENLE